MSFWADIPFPKSIRCNLSPQKQPARRWWSLAIELKLKSAFCLPFSNKLHRMYFAKSLKYFCCPFCLDAKRTKKIKGNPMLPPALKKKRQIRGSSGQGPKRKRLPRSGCFFFIHPTAGRWIARANARHPTLEEVFRLEWRSWG